MQFLKLDLHTRYRIYAQTKKVLRKYQKGIISGKLTSEQFVDNMLNDNSMAEILSGINIEISEFRHTYKDYVDTLIRIQNESLASNKMNKSHYYTQKADCASIFKLENLLENSGYNLSIPAKYLTKWDIDCISKFITTGVIDIGNEKIYNYVEKDI